MTKKIILILSCLLIIPTVTNAYFYTSDSQFKSDLMDTIRDDGERQQQIDAQRAIDKQMDDIKRQSERDLQSNRDAIRDWSDNVDREMYRVEKEWEREKAQKEEDKKWQNFLDKVELDKQQAILEKQKKELEDERKKLEEEKWNNTSREVKDAIKYVDDYVAMTPEERVIEDARKKLKSKEIVLKKVDTVNKTSPSGRIKMIDHTQNTPTSTKKVPAGSFFEEYTSQKDITNSVVNNKQQKSVFNKLKDRFFRFF